MSRSESKVENFNGFIDTEFSSGDSIKKRTKSKQPYKEENNNEIDELSKDLNEMGCIVDAVKRPPNICVETCIYEESDSDDAKSVEENEEVAYSDEFEDDKSDGEVSVKLEPKPSATNGNISHRNSAVKLSESQSFTSNKPPMSVSGKSSNYGSISVPRTRRINMSFTNERLREIERHNHILLHKILSARNVRKSTIPLPAKEQDLKRPPPAAMQRKKQQRQIDHDNMILLKKIQRAKSSSCSIRR